MTEITYERLTGESLKANLDRIAELRIVVFNDFPYLYAGDLEYEKRYLETYVQAKDAMIVVARDGDEIVGASSCLPLSAEPDDITQTFTDHGFDVSKIFYFGESVLLKSYRGRGIGVAFFHHREDHARSLKAYETVCFMGVRRDPNHPRRPADYVPLDEFWKKRGFTQSIPFTCMMSWQDLDEEGESEKPMNLWTKSIAE